MALRQSESYIWSVSEHIGQGATGNVFICRRKNTGKAYAAKVFNQMGQLRAKEVREREIELLGKLNHPNIVQLKSEESEKSTRSTVLIMELCDTSLFNILELPENYYGLSEEEFKNVFHDVANGMKYLKEQNVVHRDVKPGNILQTKSVAGRSVYKLTDFGAAKELEGANASFASIYGTEEYLHPDVYEKAIMKNFSIKSFNAAVDLWSMGVTFYHAATGQLPFRPYGGRQNKETMFEIISKKGPRVISGIQKCNGGRIDYDENLPDDTRMSAGLKSLLKPALQELLETNPKQLEHMINFEQFYQRVQDLMERKVIDLFYTGTGTWHKIYIKEDISFDILREIISEQICSLGNKHLLFWSSKEIISHETFSSLDLSQMTRDNPLIIIGGDTLDAEQLFERNFPNPPRMPRGKTGPANDLDILKVYAGICYMHKFCAEDIFWSCKASINALSSIQAGIKSRILKCRENLQYLKNFSNLLNSSLSRSIHDLHFLKEIINIKQENHETLIDNTERNMLDGEDFDQNGVGSSILDNLSEIESHLQFRNWLQINEESQLDDLLATISKHVDDVNAIYLRISKNKQSAPTIIEDLIHSAQKQEVSDCLDLIKKCYSKLQSEGKRLNSSFNNWISENISHLQKIWAAETKISHALSNTGMAEGLFQLDKIDTEKKSLFQLIRKASLDERSKQVTSTSDNVDMSLINDEVVSLESALQEVLSLVKDGDQKLLRTKEIFNELAFVEP